LHFVLAYCPNKYCVFFLQGIAIEDAGKKAIVAEGGTTILADAIFRKDLNVAALLYACRTLSNISCVPGVRTQLDTSKMLAHLRSFLAQKSSVALSRAAQVTIESIQWTP
jgi:hypothetical protein